jgi:hypothetical protein
VVVAHAVSDSAIRARTDQTANFFIFSPFPFKSLKILACDTLLYNKSRANQLSNDFSATYKIQSFAREDMCRIFHNPDVEYPAFVAIYRPPRPGRQAVRPVSSNRSCGLAPPDTNRSGSRRPQDRFIFRATERAKNLYRFPKHNNSAIIPLQ